MPTIKPLHYCLFLLIIIQWHCANQKILNPSPKIGFDLNALDQEGLIGPADGKVALDYEFCIPAENRYLQAVLKIDPSIKVHKKSKGRIACTKEEWLCIGNTHQDYSRSKIQKLAELPFIKRIARTYFE